MMILSTFPLFSRPGQFLDFLFRIGLVIGVPMLACLSFGNEFRHKTMELLVSQPVSRLKIWREKWIVVAIAILTTSLAASVFSRTPLHITGPNDLDYVMFLVVTTCSAVFWTLFARSTMGGLVLNISIVIPLGLLKFGFWDWNAATGHFSKTGVTLILSAATLGYSVVMLWMGRWMLVRRQSGAGLVGSDLMVAIPILVPRRIAGLLRCRRDQVVFNLIRKELRLLRPLWLLSALYVLCWSAIAIASWFVPVAGDGRQAMLVFLVLGSASYPVIATFLGATLPFAEERASGIQLWHLALPLSMKTQWLARLVTGLFAGLICGIGLTSVLTVLAHALLRPDIVRDMIRMTLPVPISYLLMFFVFMFWCAVMARDLPRSAVLAVAAGGMMFVAVEGSVWIAGRFCESLEQIRMFVISSYQLNPSVFHFSLDRFPNLSHIPEWISMAVLGVAMTVHTFPLFRRLPQESASRLIRPLMPYLALIAMFVFLSTIRSWNGGWVAEYTLFYDIEKAIVEAKPPNSFTVQDLTGKSTLSNDTRRWLRNSNMTLTLPVTEQPDHNRVGRLFSFGDWKVYSLTIQLPNGITCKAVFPVATDKPLKFFFSPGKCS
jgi:hypothetical protein